MKHGFTVFAILATLLLTLAFSYCSAHFSFNQLDGLDFSEFVFLTTFWLFLAFSCFLFLL